MKLADLPDIQFVDTDVNAIQAAVFESYTNITGRTVAKGDPVRLFLLVIADILVQLKNDFNYTGKQNLLKYAVGNHLDNLGALVDTPRLQATAAGTTLQVVLSGSRDQETIVPAGIRVTTGTQIYFATEDVLIIPAGQTQGTVHAVCSTVGTAGNDFLPGEISQIVDPVPYVKNITNTTKSEGGSDTEEDESYRERISEAPERFSVAGPEGAYRYYTKAINALIHDVAVTSPAPGVVEVRPLLENGTIPGEEILTQVLEGLSDKTIRPLTDKVEVKAPEAVSYQIAAKYYLNKEDKSQTLQITEAVAAKTKQYVAWQKEILGRDINPSRLISLLMEAGIKRVEVTAPVYTVLSPTQVAITDSVKVEMAGTEDE